MYLPRTLSSLVCITLFFSTNTVLAFVIENFDIFPTCSINPQDRVVLEMSILTSSAPAFLTQPSTITINGNQIEVNVYADGGNLAALDHLMVSIDLGTFPAGTYNYTVNLNARGSIRDNVEGDFSIVETVCPIPSSVVDKIYWSDALGSIKRSDPFGIKVENLAVSDVLIPSQLAMDINSSKLYWADRWSGYIHRSNLDGSQVENLVEFGEMPPQHVVLHASSNKMFWVGYKIGIYKIMTANLDGTNIEILVEIPGPIERLSVDFNNEKMYWINRSGSIRIQRSNLDGSEIEDLVPDLPFIKGFALDTRNNKMYWTGFFGSSIAKIQRANLDGTNIEDVITSDTIRPRQIVIDTRNEKIYWTAWPTPFIHRMNPDGTNLEEIIQSGGGIPWALSVNPHAGKIYWAEGGSRHSTIRRANLDGSIVEDVFTGLGSPTGIIISLTCGVEAPLNDPSLLNRIRYLSLIPGNDGVNIAIRVRLVDLDGFSSLNDGVRWVGPPAQFQDGILPQLFWASSLQCDPYYHDWGSIDFLHLFGPEVVPSSTYETQVVREDCALGIDDENAFSASITLQTGKWGDISAPFDGEGGAQPAISDVLTMVDKWLGMAVPAKVQSQLQPESINPNNPISIADILKCVDAWLGVTYPFDVPMSCP